MLPETYISVDVETAGPIPGQYALLSIGACLVEDPSRTFYVELQPDRADFPPEALSISGLSMEALKESGLAPKDAMQLLRRLGEERRSRRRAPGLRGPQCPLRLDVHQRLFPPLPGRATPSVTARWISRPTYMGLTGVTWAETSMQHISAHFLEEKHLAHNALRDAQDQAEIFQQILQSSPRRAAGKRQLNGERSRSGQLTEQSYSEPRRGQPWHQTDE